MKFHKLITLFIIVFTTNINAIETNMVEKIIFIRHGEKPLNIEIGQINCQGLNRSLKIPNVLVKKFGKPNYIFAPNPKFKMEKKDIIVSYNRPLSTIEPTAIQLGLPINVDYGYLESKEILEEILKDKYNNSVIFISWEHKKLLEIVRNIFTKDKNNSPNIIPEWPDNEFDKIYILNIIKENNLYKVTFSQDKQNLNNESKECPFPIE